MHSGTRSTRLTVQLGRWLGPAFLLCFVTGIFSHLLQEPGSLPLFPLRPVWIYQLSQGVHLVTGIAAIPLLLAKLWSVYPELLRWPPIRNLRDVLERGSIALFVAASLIELTIGLINTYKWYPWPFPFRQTHYWLAWLIIGSLVLHIAVKLPLIARHWRKNKALKDSPRPVGGWTRRGLLTGVGLSATAVVLSTAGQSFSWLAPFNIFAPRRQNTGPQAVPVNRSAAEAGISPAAVGDGWRLRLVYRGRSLELSLRQLGRLPMAEYELPVACVEGWSQSARWRGVPVRDLVALMGAPAGSTLRITSLEVAGNYRQMTMPGAYSQDEQTLLALELNGEPLDLDHGFPARVMAPGRPGVLQTKWVSSVEVLG